MYPKQFVLYCSDIRNLIEQFDNNPRDQQINMHCEIANTTNTFPIYAHNNYKKVVDNQQSYMITS